MNDNEIYRACCNNDYTSLKNLLKKGGQNLLEQINDGNCNSLAVACRNTNIPIVKLLLKHGAKPGRYRIRNDYLYTSYNDGYLNNTDLLLNACSVNNIPLIKLLVKYGAINKHLDYRICIDILKCVYDQDNIYVFELLLQNGILNKSSIIHDFNSSFSYNNYNDSYCELLHKACYENNMIMIKLMIKYSINANYYKNDTSAICIAIRSRNFILLNLLLKNGAKVYTLDNHNNESILYKLSKQKDIGSLALVLEMF